MSEENVKKKKFKTIDIVYIFMLSYFDNILSWLHINQLCCYKKLHKR